MLKSCFLESFDGCVKCSLMPFVQVMQCQQRVAATPSVKNGVRRTTARFVKLLSPTESCKTLVNLRVFDLPNPYCKISNINNDIFQNIPVNE